jgi:hypothetical protein
VVAVKPITFVNVVKKDVFFDVHSKADFLRRELCIQEGR